MPTFAEWLREWVDGRAARREVQPDVLKKAEQALQSRAVPYLGHLRLTAIDQEVLRDWVGYMSSQRVTQGSKNRVAGDRLLKAETIRRTHSILHTCLGAAVPKWLGANPAARPAGSRKHASGLPKAEPFDAMFLTRDELSRIVGCCSPHIRDMVVVASRTGLRLGELCALPVRDVVFSGSGATIRVRSALKNDGEIGAPKSEKSRRDVTVGRTAAGLLRARAAGRRPRDLLFTSPQGMTWCENNFNSRFWKRAVAQARRCDEHPPPLPDRVPGRVRRLWRPDEVSVCGCAGVLVREPRFHDLRHSHASYLIDEGWSAKKIQERLGHANYQTTMNIYGHLFSTGSSEELDRLDALLD